MIRDSDWVKRAFLTPPEELVGSSNPRVAATYTSAAYKFVGTAIGENFSLNNPTQHSPLADPRVKGRLPGSGGSMLNSASGLGIKYSEMYDDQSHLVHMRFGHASFSSMESFVSNIFDYEASLMANTGRTPGFFYAAGYAAGVVTALPFLGYIMFAKGLSLVYSSIAGGSTSSNYMSVKPAMYEFWGAVSWIYNSIGVNQELVWPYDAEDPTNIDADVGRSLSMLSPSIISDNGMVDIFAVALRGQRLANENRKNMLQTISDLGDTPTQMFTALKAQAESQLTTNNVGSYEKYVSLYTALPTNAPPAGNVSEGSLNRTDYETSWWDDVKATSDNFSGNLGSAINDGADWLCLRVNHQHDFKISINNTTKSNPLADKVNGMQSKVKDANYMLAGGNLGDGAITGAVETVLQGGKDFLAGAADSWGVSGLAMLMTGAHADIPNIHDSSSFDLPATTYTIDIDLPYGNAWMEYLHATPIVCALMAAAMPISNGKYSYSSPFYCELYDKSRAQIRRGLVTDVSIERGTHEIGMTHDRRTLGMKIEFTVTDLNEIMHMPLDPNDNVWDGDSAFSDFLATYSGSDIYTQFYQYPKLKMKLRKAAVNVQQSLSTAKMAMSFSETMFGKAIRAFERAGDYK